ncbi:MAG: SPOR domain-containing protein [Bacteroidales bacterium]|nr:SPOR domain-containing protein [Bacteroidales bacterium]
MNLYNLVYQLIKENDCVIIPEFGGFVCNYFEAKIDLSNQEFCPPVKKIAFNRELKNNDGLLINYLTREYNIEWKEAENHVNDFVNELNKVLQDNKYLKFDNIGEFIIRDNTIVFVPCADQNLLENSFGLKRFNFPMLKTGKKGIAIQKQVILSKSKEAKTNKKKRRISPAIFYSSAVAVIAGLIVIAFQFDLIRLEKQALHQNANIVPVELLTNSNSSETENTSIPADNSIIEIAEDVALENDFAADTEIETVESETVETTIIDNTSSFNVHVIGGSFANITNADNYKQKLINSGFSSQVLPVNNGMYRVAVKSFPENSVAIAELQSLRNKTGNQSLWVLCN